MSDTAAISLKNMNNTTNDQDQSLETTIQNYLSSLRNIGQTIRIVFPHLSQWLIDECKQLQQKLERFVPAKATVGEQILINLESAHDFAEYTSIMKSLEDLDNNKALSVLVRSLFMQIFCEFDAFMGNLLRNIYLRNKDLLKGISREISLADLIEYENLDSVKAAILDKEIETFRRDSYVEQFAQLEKKFGLTLRKFPEWGEFVELSQRRNIFTHNDGIVSDQYLSVCDRENTKFSTRPSLGETLTIEIEYFGRALILMSKVGYMLCYTLWSKIFPHEQDEIHDSQNNILYKCLEQKRWKLASELGDFSLTDPMRKKISEINLRVRVINVAIALKFSDQHNEAMKLLHTIDWSASYRDFKLAISVLEDKFDDAISIMESIGKSGEIIEQSAYHTWPLFHKFREHQEFYTTYEKIYGVSYLANIPSDSPPLKINETSQDENITDS